MFGARKDALGETTGGGGQCDSTAFPTWGGISSRFDSKPSFWENTPLPAVTFNCFSTLPPLLLS
jgi:hypothetical protein